jgi:hypothetical protein
MLRRTPQQVWVGVMNRFGMTAVLVVLGCAMASPIERAAAQSSSGATRLAQAVPQDRYRRPPGRIRVTPYYQEQGVVPHYNPGPNAVRVCNAHYEQEYRPSGTVIVPRMRCYWTRG